MRIGLRRYLNINSKKVKLKLKKQIKSKKGRIRVLLSFLKKMRNKTQYKIPLLLKRVKKTTKKILKMRKIH